MSGLACGERDPHGLEIAHLADDNHVGRLTKRRAERCGEIRRVHADLYLLDHALLVCMLVFDRVLYREDVLGVAPVDLVDKGRNRGGFAGARRPANQHETVWKSTDLFELRGQAQIRKLRGMYRQRPNRRRRSSGSR